MSIFENRRFTIISISTLVLLNLILLGLIVGPTFGKRDADRRGGDQRSAYMAEKLGFTENQIQTYDSLNASHRQETGALQQNIDEKRRMMFQLSRSSSVTIEQADSLSLEIGVLVSDMEFRTYEHISNVRALCTPPQLAQLDSLIQQMIKRRQTNERERDRNGSPSR